MVHPKPTERKGEHIFPDSFQPFWTAPPLPIGFSVHVIGTATISPMLKGRIGLLKGFTIEIMRTGHFLVIFAFANWELWIWTSPEFCSNCIPGPHWAKSIYRPYLRLLIAFKASRMAHSQLCPQDSKIMKGHYRSLSILYRLYRKLLSIIHI